LASLSQIVVFQGFRVRLDADVDEFQRSALRQTAAMLANRKHESPRIHALAGQIATNREKSGRVINERERLTQALIFFKRLYLLVLFIVCSVTFL
jgi:hypothetical protein